MLAIALATAPAAAAAEPRPVPELDGLTPLGPDVKRLHFTYGPIPALPGQNLILLGPVTLEKPLYDGYVTRIRPNLVRADGSVPNVETTHMHHAVFLNLSNEDGTSPGLPERFYAFGEEKTIMQLPPGYGYGVRARDVWLMNYMLHNQTTRPELVWVTYEVDYVTKNSPTGRRMREAHPLWFDVRNGEVYPVFDSKRGTGGRDRRFTYPHEAARPYPRRKLNDWTAPRDGTLLATAGHVHPGGLWTDLHLIRGARQTLAFRSEANYFDPNGPVSWDMAMGYTPRDWRVGVKRGDKLRINATYESRRASWYESMGIMIAYWAYGPGGPDPFASPPVTRGPPTHGHLSEASNYGGEDVDAPNPETRPGAPARIDRVRISGFLYRPGDLGRRDMLGAPPVIDPGQSLTFENGDANSAVYHSVTACAPPCNRTTGISYPLADGEPDFDSGQLGYGPRSFTAANNRVKWQTPRNLDPGTYTYFCRVHPFMRGSFRVRGTRRCRARVVVSRRARRTRRGERSLALPISCRGSAGTCDGTLRLVTAGRRPVTLATRRFRVRAGRRTAVRVALSRGGRRLLRRNRRARVRAVAVERSGGCRFTAARATFTLRASRR